MGRIFTIELKEFKIISKHDEEYVCANNLKSPYNLDCIFYTYQFEKLCNIVTITFTSGFYRHLL